MTPGQDGRGDHAAPPVATWSSPLAASFEDAEKLLRQLATNEDDRFGVMTRCARQRHATALLVDTSRLYAQTVVRIGHAYASVGPPPWPDGWLEARIDAALDDILLQDRRDEDAGLVESATPTPPHEFMTLWFGIEPAVARRATVRFNGLPERTRKTFFALVLDRRSVDECDSQGLGPRSTMHAALQDAFRALLLLPDLSGSSRGGTDS